MNNKNITQIVIKGHPEYGDITEGDILATMQENNMSREEVIVHLSKPSSKKSIISCQICHKPVDVKRKIDIVFILYFIMQIMGALLFRRDIYKKNCPICKRDALSNKDKNQ